MTMINNTKNTACKFTQIGHSEEFGTGIANVLEFNYQPQARNKLLAKAFKEIGKIEKYGSGIKRIYTICKDYGIIPPKFNIKQGSFEVVLYKEKRNVTDNVTDNVTENNILNIIATNNNITTSELAEKLKLTRRTIARYINKLKDKGVLKRIGPDKGGYWEIIK